LVQPLLLDGGDIGSTGCSRVQVAVEDGVDGRAAEGEGVASGGEGDDGDGDTAEDGESGGFLEEPLAALGEGHLQGLLVLDLLNWDLLAAEAAGAVA